MKVKTVKNNRKTLITKLPFIGNILNWVDDEVGKCGFQEAMMKTIKHSHSRMTIHGKTDELIEVLKNKPVVIVANHPYELETIALIASLPKREDMFIITHSDFVGVCPNIDKHLIPVYIDHHRDEKYKKTISSIKDKFIKIFHSPPGFEPDDEHKKNVESIAKASKKVSQGNMVIIFPGRRSPDGKWYSGVGHLLKGTKKKDVYVVKVHIEGTSNWDYFRAFPYIGRILKTVKVYFDKPKILGELINHDAKKIVVHLQKEYDEWVKKRCA